MKYTLGYMDKYPIEAAGSVIENCPMCRAVFKCPIDPVRLEAAVRSALVAFPLFATQVEFDKEYYLASNDRPLVILNCTEADRPKTFGKNTNRYPWRIVYHDRSLCLEWIHGVTDGAGGMAFFKQILACYYGDAPEEKTLNHLLAPGMEPFIDFNEKGDGFHIDPPGFPSERLPKAHKCFTTDCHALHTDTKELLDLAHASNSSVTPVLAVLFSKALRMHIPANFKKHDVASSILIDLRRPLQYQTMHNCIDVKRLTYTDMHDKMSFGDVASSFKEALDRARLKPNIIRSITSRINLFKIYHVIPSKIFQKLCMKIYAPFFKRSDCNVNITYPGKIELPDYVAENIENVDFKVWHDLGSCVLAATDYYGRFNLNITENFADKGIVEDFIKLSASLGIHWVETECSAFRQAHFVE